MYLSKQWHESRNFTVIALLALLLLFLALARATLKIDSAHNHENGPEAFAMTFVALFYGEAVLLAFWGWVVASIGAGKNLGEESGSFLFTRPRRRAWFLWNDWAFGMAHLAIIILLANLMIGWFLEHSRALMHISRNVRFMASGNSTPFMPLLLLVSIGVLIFAGLVYSLTYFSTIMMKRASGVIAGAGIFAGYLVLRGLIAHYYPSIQLPSPIPSLFHLENHRVYGLAGHLGLALAVRTGVILLFPIAAQLILDRSEI